MTLPQGTMVTYVPLVRNAEKIIQSCRFAERFSKDPLKQKQFERICFQDLPAAYIWTLLDPHAKDTIKAYALKHPGLFSSNKNQIAMTSILVLIPGFLRFLSSISDKKDLLGLECAVKFKHPHSPFLGFDTPQQIAALMTGSYLQPNLQRYGDLILKSDPEEELRQACLVKKRGSIRVGIVLRDWTFRMLLLPLAFKERAESYLTRMYDILERYTDDNWKEAWNCEGHERRDEDALSGEQHLCWRVGELREDPFSVVRWKLACGLSGMERREHLVEGSIRETQKALVENCIRYQGADEIAQRPKVVEAVEAWLGAAILYGKEGGDFFSSVITDLKELQERVQEQSCGLREDIDVYARFEQETGEWVISWRGAFRGIRLKPGPKDKSIAMVFRAIETAKWITKEGQARVNLDLLRKEFYPDAHAQIVQTREQWSDAESAEIKAKIDAQLLDMNAGDWEVIRKRLQVGAKRISILAGATRMSGEIRGLFQTRYRSEIWSNLDPAIVHVDNGKNAKNP